MTDDLTTWLWAVLDEIEADAKFYIDNGATGPGREWAQLVLADVAAKRRIIDVYRAEVIDVGMPGRPEWVHGRVPVEAHTAMRLLALPYADRPGYREEWRP